MEWILFFTAFSLLFLGELGDKTQLIVFNLSLEHEKSYKIGIGATIGFAIIVTVGVIFGAVITKFFPISVITLISGIIFILIGILEIPKIKKLYDKRKSAKLGESKVENVSYDEINSKEVIPTKLSKLKNNPFLAGFLFILIMELGDKTQILTITLVSVYSSPLEVWFGSFLALISLAWMGVFFGALIARKIPKFYLKLVSMTIFIIIGIVTLFTLL